MEKIATGTVHFIECPVCRERLTQNHWECWVNIPENIPEDELELITEENNRLEEDAQKRWEWEIDLFLKEHEDCENKTHWLVLITSPTPYFVVSKNATKSEVKEIWPDWSEIMRVRKGKTTVGSQNYQEFGEKGQQYTIAKGVSGFEIFNCTEYFETEDYYNEAIDYQNHITSFNGRSCAG